MDRVSSFASFAEKLSTLFPECSFKEIKRLWSMEWEREKEVLQETRKRMEMELEMVRWMKTNGEENTPRLITHSLVKETISVPPLPPSSVVADAQEAPQTHEQEEKE